MNLLKLQTTMKREIVNEQVPSGYPICTSKSCNERAHCLHSYFAPEVLREARTFTMINQQHPNYQEGKACELYCSNKPERYARGLTKAMGEMSHNNYVAFTNYLIAKHTKTQFYRIKRGDIPLSPAEQAELLELLRTYGCTGEEPFDSYEMRYTWY